MDSQEAASIYRLGRYDNNFTVIDRELFAKGRLERAKGFIVGDLTQGPLPETGHVALSGAEIELPQPSQSE